MGLFDKKSSMTVKVDKLWLMEIQQKQIVRAKQSECAYFYGYDQ